MAHLINEAKRMQQLAGIPFNTNDIILTENLYNGLQFYIESVYPSMLVESKNKDIILEGFLTNIINKVKDSASKNKVINFFSGIGIALNKITDPKFKELFKNALKAVSGGGMSKEQIIAAFDKKSVKEAEEQKGSGYQIIQKLADFFDINTKYKVARTFILSSLIAAVTLKMNQNSIKHPFEKGNAETTQLAKDQATKNNIDNTTTNYNDELKKQNVKMSEVDDSVEEGKVKSTVGIQFDYAKGTVLTDSAKATLDDFAQKLIKHIDDGDLKSAKLKVAGTVSRTTGDVEKAKDTNKKLSQARGETVIKYLTDKLVKYINDGKIKIEQGSATDNLKNQTQEKEGGNAASGALIHVDGETGKGPVNLSWEDWPEYAKYDGGVPNDAGTEEPISGDKEETLPQSEPAPTTPTSSQDIKSTSAEFAKLNRNGQIATVLAKINPGLDIAKRLGQEKITSYSDTYFAKTKGNVRKIATLIMNIRKSPDAFLKKVANATGVKLNARAKAVATKVAPGTQAQLQSIKESSLIYLLQEAMIDQISDADIRNNQDIILALLGTMYASAGNTELSIIPKDSNQAKKFKDLGFTPQPGGNYVFLAPGQTKAQVQAPDVTRVFISIKKNQALIAALKRINTRQELQELILNITKFVNANVNSKPKDIRTDLFSISTGFKKSKVTEAGESPDVEKSVQIIDRYTGLKSLISNVNSRKEYIEFIKELLSYVDPTLFAKRESDVKAALVGAANSMTNAGTVSQRQKK